MSVWPLARHPIRSVRALSALASASQGIADANSRASLERAVLMNASDQMDFRMVLRDGVFQTVTLNHVSILDTPAAEAMITMVLRCDNSSKLEGNLDYHFWGSAT